MEGFDFADYADVFCFARAPDFYDEVGGEFLSAIVVLVSFDEVFFYAFSQQVDSAAEFAAVVLGDQFAECAG